MKARRFIVLAACASLVLVPSCLWSMGERPGAEGPGLKPGTPVSVSIVSVDGATPMPGDTVELVVTVSSSVASESLGVSLTLSGGAELLSGEKYWILSTEGGTVNSRRITVRFPDHPGGKVSARATLREKGGGRYSGHASLSAPPRKGASTGNMPDGSPGRDSQGRPVMEYRGH